LRVDFIGLVIVVVLLLGSLTTLVYPLFLPSTSDKGDGLSVVRLGQNTKGHFTRPTLLFAYITFATVILIVDYQHFASWYSYVVRAVDTAVVPGAPSTLELVSAGPFPVLYRKDK
jgi:hypothetical protein